MLKKVLIIVVSVFAIALGGCASNDYGGTYGGGYGGGAASGGHSH